MVDRYCSVEDIKKHLELSSIDADTTPDRETVEGWITASEEEIDSKIQGKIDVNTYTQRFRPNSTSRTIYLRNSPINSVSSFAKNTGDEWNPVWEEIGTSRYRLALSDAGTTTHIRTEDYFGEEAELKVVYEAGKNTIPSNVKELAILLTERRALQSKMAVASQELETVSIATLRLQDKTRASIEYKITILDNRIKELFDAIGKGFYSKNVNFGMVWY